MTPPCGCTRRRWGELAARRAIVVLASLASLPIQAQTLALQAQGPLGAMPGTGQSLQWTSGPRGTVAYLPGVNGALATLPATTKGPDYSRQSGLQLSFFCDWPGQFGYRPVVFTVATAKPTLREQRITIQFTTGDYYGTGNTFTAEQSFVFPLGATTASTRILSPQYQDWHLIKWRVLVDGRKDDFLAVDYLNTGPYGPNSTNLGVICAGATPAQAASYQGALQGAFNASAVSVKSLALAELPTSWVDYSTIDVVILPAGQVEPLLSAEPRAAQALLRWVRAGGNLWLTEAGSDWQALLGPDQAIGGFGMTAGEQEETASDRATGQADAAGEQRLLDRGWRYPPTNDRAGEPADAALVLSGFDTGRPPPALQKLISSPLAEAVSNYLWPAPGKGFMVRGHGLGVLTAFRSGLGGSFNPSGNPLFVVMGRTLVQPRISWATRHGNQPNAYNPDFNKLLIPNVGVAPVGLFQALITLFVLGIGPLNYWLLKRNNKLPMLLFTAPAAALATTALLFAYGLFADGFGVRTRSRTLTLLDQRTGEAASWGWLSYYAGIAPSSGLVIPRDQVMYPMYPSWAVGYSPWTGGAMRQQRELTWADQQLLTAGWLASRTPTQYQAIAARSTNKKLDLRATGEGLRIVNRLGTEVTHLAVEDERGRIYWCESLAPDQGRIVPAEADRDKVAGRVRRLFTDNQPEAPAGADNGYSGANYDFVASQSVMEGRLEAINSPQVRSWGRGKYIAFTKEAIELDLGLEDVDEQASFHVIEGTW